MKSMGGKMFLEIVQKFSISKFQDFSRFKHKTECDWAQKIIIKTAEIVPDSEFSSMFKLKTSSIKAHLKFSWIYWIILWHFL